MKYFIVMLLAVVSMNAFASESTVSEYLAEMVHDSEVENMQNALDRQASALEGIQTEMMLNNLK